MLRLQSITFRGTLRTRAALAKEVVAIDSARPNVSQGIQQTIGCRRSLKEEQATAGVRRNKRVRPAYISAGLIHYLGCGIDRRSIDIGLQRERLTVS
jgi:hypothetical protein